MSAADTIMDRLRKFRDHLFSAMRDQEEDVKVNGARHPGLLEPMAGILRARLDEFDEILAAIDPRQLAPVGPRAHYEWCEEDGSVLWWLWPIEQPPYVGSPLDLGYAVEASIDLAASDRSCERGKMRMQVGGWPWVDADDDTTARLFWTPLPDCDAIDRAIRAAIAAPLEDQ